MNSLLLISQFHSVLQNLFPNLQKNPKTHKISLWFNLRKKKLQMAVKLTKSFSYFVGILALCLDLTWEFQRAIGRLPNYLLLKLP